MLGRLALLMVLGAVSACDAPPQAAVPVPAPAPEEPAIVLSSKQIHDRSEKCAKKARETFRRDSGGDAVAEFAHHYSIKLDTCFYLLTVQREEKVSRTLLDINENEIYGEFLGPSAADWPAAAFPDTCKVDGLHCASGREWLVLAGPFMEQ